MPQLILRILTILCLILVASAYFAIESYKKSKLALLNPPYQCLYNQEPKETELLIFGDSRAAHWDNVLFKNYGNIVNSGISGDVTPSMLVRLKHDVINFKPSKVLIVAGINDIVTGSLMKTEEQRRLNLRSTISNLNEIVKRLIKADIKVIILTITPPLQPDIMRRLIWGKNINSDIIIVNQAIMAFEQKNVVVVDTMAIFRSAGPTWVEMIRKDTLHYTPIAYRLLSKKISSIIWGNR